MPDPTTTTDRIGERTHERPASPCRRDVLPHGWAVDPWFSAAIEIDRPARWLVTGAIGPLAENGTVLHELDPTAQVALTVANLERVLGAADLDLSHVIRVSVVTVDLPAVRDQLDLVAERLTATGARPALCLYGVAELVHAGALLSLDAVAAAA